jgi:hypothetical protein
MGEWSATLTLEGSFAVARHSGAIAKIISLTSRARTAQLQFSNRVKNIQNLVPFHPGVARLQLCDLILFKHPTSNLFIYLPAPGRGRSRFLPPGSRVLVLQRIIVMLHFLSYLLFGQALVVSGGNEWHSFVDLDQYE